MMMSEEVGNPAKAQRRGEVEGRGSLPKPDLKGFVKAIFKAHFANSCMGVDGEDMQEYGEKFGIIQTQIRRVPCCDSCGCREYMDKGDMSHCSQLNPRIDEPTDNDLIVFGIEKNIITYEIARTGKSWYNLPCHIGKPWRIGKPMPKKIRQYLLAAFNAEREN